MYEGHADAREDERTEAGAVRDVLSDLAGLSTISPLAPWAQVESVLEARFEWERVPLDPVSGGAVHVGALEAMAGLTFRLVAIPGLVEGGYPGAPRPDPFLLDSERFALNALADRTTRPPAPAKAAQLSLFDASDAMGPRPAPLATTQDRVLEARRLFRRAVTQATERLVLSYPRADARSGRERMPSLFFVAAASALEGRPVAVSDLARLVVEDDPQALDLDALLDASERDRARVRKGGEEAARQIAAGSLFFRQSRLASRARFSSDYTPYDGLVAWAPRDGVTSDTAARVRARLDPTSPGATMSASRLATYARCGFQYLLQHVLRLDPALEPEERKRLEPLERGSLFHDVAERFLRECRRQGELPVKDSEAMRARVLELADEALARLVQGSPPRFTLLWERERQRFRETLLAWLAREAAAAGTTTPAFFEVSFGLPVPEGDGEPHSPESLVIDLGDGRTLRVNGKIDRIDRAPDGTLVLRDYKTGKAPWKDDGGLFKGGRQLQIPFYILAAARLFPEEPVSKAFLDYVDGGRLVTVDPAVVKSEKFTALLRGFADAISQGLFVQEPSACVWCDYTSVCGPAPLIGIRRNYKINDPRVRHVLHLRDIG
jgi:RecB family exonuclease